MTKRGRLTAEGAGGRVSLQQIGRGRMVEVRAEHALKRGMDLREQAAQAVAHLGDLFHEIVLEAAQQASVRQPSAIVEIIREIRRVRRPPHGPKEGLVEFFLSPNKLDDFVVSVRYGLLVLASLVNHPEAITCIMDLGIWLKACVSGLPGPIELALVHQIDHGAGTTSLPIGLLR